MGLFSFLFGKKKKENTAESTSAIAINKQEETAKTEQKIEETIKETAEAKSPAPKKAQSPAKKKTEPKEAKPSEAEKTEKKEDSKPIEEIKEELYDTEKADAIAEDAATEKVSVKGYGGAFEIKKSKDGRYVFNLYAANHVIIATSQIYSSAQSANIGIKSVIANAEKAAIEDQTLATVNTESFPKWEIYTDKSGQYRFRLLASNGSCVCHSQGYTKKASCKNGIESIIRTVKSATIDKAYLKKDQ